MVVLAIRGRQGTFDVSDAAHAGASKRMTTGERILCYLAHLAVVAD